MSNQSEFPLPERSLLDSDLVQFIGMNQEPLMGLATFVSISEGFTLGFAEVNFASDGDRLLAALRQRPECSTIQFEVLRLSNPQIRHVLEELKQILPTLQVAPGKKLVLMLYGLENAIGVIGEYPPILADLNFVRDILAKQVPHPMVFVLPDYAITRIARYAYDFWSWSSGVFTFRTAQQTLDTVHDRMLQPDRLYSSESRPAKQERIDLLQRLLMEYEGTDREVSPGQAKNRLNILLELGNAYRSLSDYRRADLFYQQALPLAQELGDRIGEANVLQEFGRLQDDPLAGLDYLQQAQKIYEQIGDQYSQSRNLRFVSEKQIQLQEVDAAIESLQQSAAIAHAIGYEPLEKNALNRIAKLQNP